MLSKTNGLLAFNLTVVLFSMVGIPPLAGFWSKFYLFFATISSSLYTVALVGVLASVVSCFFYIRMIKTMYFESLSTSPIVKPVVKKWVSYEPLHREKSIIQYNEFQISYKGGCVRKGSYGFERKDLFYHKEYFC